MTEAQIGCLIEPISGAAPAHRIGRLGGNWCAGSMVCRGLRRLGARRVRPRTTGQAGAHMRPIRPLSMGL